MSPIKSFFARKKKSSRPSPSPIITTTITTSITTSTSIPATQSTPPAPSPPLYPSSHTTPAPSPHIYPSSGAQYSSYITPPPNPGGASYYHAGYVMPGYYPPPSYHFPEPSNIPMHHSGPSQIPQTVTQPEDEPRSAEHRRYIEPDGDTFLPSKDPVKKLTNIIKSKYDAPYLSWTRIPLDVRDMWFREFEKFFYWLPQHHDRIRRNFDKCASARLSDMFNDARTLDTRPDWIGESVWLRLCAEWNRPDYVKRREQNKQNRASDCAGLGSSLHTGGSIPHTEHRRRMKNVLGREPTPLELHTQTHQRKADKQWVDSRAQKTHIQDWRDIGVANLPGVISLAAGLLMWVTSLRPVRRTYFELFFYTHQLYVIFVVFLALHVGDFIFSYAAGAIFLFILDRFLRFCQSRATVDIISAACRPCGTVELILSKPPGLQYNALSFIFLQVRELSWLQWHPFSVSSSPLDGNHHLSVLIKVLGEWTAKLRDIITSVSVQSQKDQLNKITAYVEGPYGHESPYHLMYENLILVAGGIGISPFFAILSDILHLSGEGKPCLPKNILVVWAVKKSKELSLLSTVDAHSISPSFSDMLHLEIQTYVTQGSEPLLEDGIANEKMEHPSLLTTTSNTMSCLVGTGHTVWAGVYVLVSTFGFIVLYALLELYYLKPFQVFSWWHQGLLVTLCMVASVVILGTIVVFFWDKGGKKSSSYERWMVNNDENKSLVNHNGLVPHDETGKENLSRVQSIKYGSRPDFRERVGHVNVGVIVCGPPSLQSSVARECRYQNIRGKWNHPIFHFNSHSFDL